MLVQVDDLQLAPGQKPKELSTKFIWRDKVVKGNRVLVEACPLCC